MSGQSSVYNKEWPSLQSGSTNGIPVLIFSFYGPYLSELYPRIPHVNPKLLHLQSNTIDRAALYAECR
jgi:CRISPR/Cas system-associated endonuclease Cas1